MIGQPSGFASLKKLTFGTRYCAFDVQKFKSTLEWGHPYSNFSFGEVNLHLYVWLEIISYRTSRKEKFENSAYLNGLSISAEYPS